MPLLSLYDSAGARGLHDGRRCRFLIDYVDLEKADVSLKTTGLITLIKRHKYAATKRQDGTQVPIQLESWKERCLLLDGPLRPEHQPVVGLVSTPSYKRHLTREPHHINLLSLPPSSPLVSSPQGSDAVALPEEDVGNADPFGFLAAEKKLKAQRVRCPSIAPYPESVSEEHSSFREVDHSKEVFACQSSLAVNEHEVFSASVEHKKRIVVSMSPSASLLINSSDTPSPCRKAMRCRSTTGGEVIGGVKKSQDKVNFDEYKRKPTT